MWKSFKWNKAEKNYTNLAGKWKKVVGPTKNNVQHNNINYVKQKLLTQDDFFSLPFYSARSFVLYVNLSEN